MLFLLLPSLSSIIYAFRFLGSVTYGTIEMYSKIYIILHFSLESRCNPVPLVLQPPGAIILTNINAIPQQVGLPAVTLTCNWTEHTSPEGFKYYYNSVTRESKVRNGANHVIFKKILWFILMSFCVLQWEKPEEYVLYEQQQQKLLLLQQHQQKIAVQQLQSPPQGQSLPSMQPLQQLPPTQEQTQMQMKQQVHMQFLLSNLASGCLFFLFSGFFFGWGGWVGRGVQFIASILVVLYV